MATFDNMKIVTLQDLENNLGTERFPAFMMECEREFKRQVDAISKRVIEDHSIRMIFLSGPTSSGKTTFSTLFTQNLVDSGRRTYLISLDDYYFTEPLEYDEAGRPDYESINTLELDLLFEHLKQLQNGEEVNIPTFDFKNRARLYEEHKKFRLEEGDVVMIEGLHALSEQLFNDQNRHESLGIFIMPYMRFLHDSKVLDSKDIRMLRRISRDVFHRGSPAMSTIDYWPMISSAEREFVPEYLAAADYYVNSALPYEFCVIVPKAQRVLSESIEQYHQGELPPSTNVKPGLFYADLNRAFKEAKRLIKACEMIPEVDSSIVPADSILQEFI